MPVVGSFKFEHSAVLKSGTVSRVTSANIVNFISGGEHVVVEISIWESSEAFNSGAIPGCKRHIFIKKSEMLPSELDMINNVLSFVYDKYKDMEIVQGIQE